MIKFKSPHLLKALDIAFTGNHSLLIITNDIEFIKKIISKLQTCPENPKYFPPEKLYIEKPCPCRNFNNTNRMCKCMPEEIRKWQMNLPQTNMTIIVNDFPFEYLEFDKSNIEKEGLNFLETAYSTKGMLPSELEATLKVAKTLSKMDKEDKIKAMHIAEALQYVLGKEFYL